MLQFTDNVFHKSVKWIHWKTRICSGILLHFAAVAVFVCAREREQKEREHGKQRPVQSDEADGNHSLDRQGREEVGEEEMGLAVKSATHRNNIFKPFSKTSRHRFLHCEKKQAVKLSW